MIIQVRGTSGSGKSWVVRNLLGPLYPISWWHRRVPGRRRPWWSKSGKLYVLGHYESPCGGCDGIGSAAAVFNLYKTILRRDPDAIILSEGLLLSEDFKWTAEAHNRGWDPRVAYLATNVDQCVEQVKSRRKQAGKTKPFKEDNTRYRVKVIERSKLKLEEAGVVCRYVTASKASELVLDWIRNEQ